MSEIKHNHIAAIILSGGLGSRMDGIDKGLQTHKGEALISWVIKSVSPQVGKTILSINRNQNDYNKFGFEIVTDYFDSTSEKKYNGPIAGILSGVKKINSPEYTSILIASCDSPNLNHRYVYELNSSLIKSKADVAIVNDGVRNQNLHCLINLNAINGLTQYYRQGGRSMHGWLKTISLVEVDFSNNANDFINLNKLKDLET